MVQQNAGALTFVLHALPFGASSDYALNQQWDEMKISLAGDAAWLVGGVGGALLAHSGRAATVGRGMLIGVGAIEGGLGIYRAKDGVDAVQRGEYLDAAGYFGDAALRFLGASSHLTRGLKVPGKALDIDSGQLGKKLGKHTSDFGFDPSNPADRARIKQLIEDIGRRPDRSVPGSFRGQGPGGTRGPVEFRIKGTDVVVTTPDGRVITILKNGINNPSVLDALKKAVE